MKAPSKQGWSDIALLGTFVAGAILLGGATREGFLLHAVIQIAALGLIAFVMISPSDPSTRSGRRFVILALALLAVQLLQLVPLPYSLWSHLAGRAVVAQGFSLAGLGQVAAPLSLSPEGTVQCALAVIPPLAVFLFIQLRHRVAAMGAVVAVLGAAALSALLGLAQVVGGMASPLYLYEDTNRGDAVGFFSNANHLSTLLVASIPLAIGLAGWLRSRGMVLRKAPLPFLLIAGLVPLAALGVIASGSVAGLILLLFVIVASVPILLSNLGRRWRWVLIGGTLLMVVGAIGVGVFSPNLGDFAKTDVSSSSETGRLYMWRTTWSAIHAYFPYGSGFGSFESVFRLFEDPDLVKSTFANHAHNDLLEFVLESGLPGVLLLVLFLGWFVRRLWVIWFADGGRRMALAKGASVALTAILLHSLVDYPVRTTAMAVVFGLCCALMARNEDVAPTVASETKSSARHLSA